MPNQFKPVVVTPTYNNVRTLPNILRRVEALGLAIIVVNDGSTDGTAEALAEWADRAIVITHKVNQGKAAAMLTGFAAADKAGFTHAVTMDTDGQLDPEQIPELIRLAQRSPEALVLSYRDDTKADYPARSRMGRRLSNMMVLIESGVRVQDSQCGLRVYPLGLMRLMRCGAGYFGFETEIITRAGWAGCPMVESPVRCRYLPPGQRISHFKPCKDTLRSLAMHLRLVGRAMLPWPKHPEWPPREAVVRIGPNDALWRRLWKWISPVEAWRQVREDQLNRSWFAAGFAVGVLIANLPIYGLQTIAAIYTARRLHLHPLSVVAGSHLSTPPINFALWMAGISTGHLVLHGSLPTWPHFALADIKLWSLSHVWWMLSPYLLDLTVGGIINGLFLGWLAFLITGRLLKLVQPAPAPEAETAEAQTV